MRFLLVVGGVIAAAWLVPIFLTDASGLKFGFPYRVFFTLFTLFAGFLFYLLRGPAVSPIESAPKAVASVVAVFLGSVGLIVLLANLSPQFAFESKAALGQTSQEKGKVLFNDPNVGCFLCHQVAGSGGTRGPDLTRAASVAAQRQPALSAEDYLKESINNPGTYVVPSYDNIMPPYAQRISPEQLRDLIAYLMTLK
ncbi:MAG: cytochrome c [Chloroflexi bacterium]|nr:cytochrome c [Chloroflexota bacterium]